MTKIYTGYVYVMDGETGEIKIGVSREPAKRLPPNAALADIIRTTIASQMEGAESHG